MRIAISGFESPVCLVAGTPHVLEIENKTLFTRVCRSLTSGDGPEALEAYSLWGEDGREVSSRDAFLVVGNPLCLPWDDKRLGGRLYEAIETLMHEDEESRAEIEKTAQVLSTAVARLTYRVGAEYEFGLEWSLRQFLKSRAFKVDRYESSSYLDSLISFLDFCSDMRLHQPILFVNLKSFLNEKDLEEVYERVFFHGFEILLLEPIHDEASYGHEQKTRVDLHFLESCK